MLVWRAKKPEMKGWRRGIQLGPPGGLRALDLLLKVIEPSQPAKFGAGGGKRLSPARLVRTDPAGGCHLQSGLGKDMCPLLASSLSRQGLVCLDTAWS